MVKVIHIASQTVLHVVLEQSGRGRHQKRTVQSYLVPEDRCKEVVDMTVGCTQAVGTFHGLQDCEHLCEVAILLLCYYLCNCKRTKFILVYVKTSK